MDTEYLFRKHTPMAEDRLPWLRGSEEHTWTAKRNTSGRGVVSAILVRALLSALEGSILEAQYSISADHVQAVVRSCTKPGTKAACWLDWSSTRCGVPHGEEAKVTYHLGVLAIVQALADPGHSQDFWQAYLDLLGSFREVGRSAEIKASLCLAADELYYFLRYGSADPEPSQSRLEMLKIGPQHPAPQASEMFSLNLDPLTDPEGLRKLLGSDTDMAQPAVPDTEVFPVSAGFVGWQVEAMAKALVSGENILLAGPTGSGKTYALHQVVQHMDHFLVTIEGKEGVRHEVA